MTHSSGIHHITVIASDPVRNLRFYTQFLGLRLVKQTVNFDDPETYHLYFADRQGSPGTVLTFFPHPNAQQGRAGVGQAVEIGFSIPESALAFWIDRLHQANIPYQGSETRFGQKLVRFQDPDGVWLELIADNTTTNNETWATADVPMDVAIRGFHSVTLWVDKHDSIDKLLTDVFKLHAIGQEETRHRYSTKQNSDENGLGQIIDLRVATGFLRGVPGAGTIHHVAMRAADDTQEQEMQQTASALGYRTTEVIDRKYFHSVYFRERNGILFEIATDGPGFAVDEAIENLGEVLQIPPHYEAHREAIITSLPPLYDTVS